MNETFIAHHGSPGTPQDFNEISKELENSQWQLQDRSHSQYDGDTPNSIQIGYSFGSFFALKEAARKANQTKAVVLIAPFLFPKKKPSLIQKIVLSLPVLGTSIIKKKGNQAIEEMLINSSYPHDVPPSYTALKETLKRPSVLSTALLEKDIQESDVQNFLSILKDKKIPIYLISGDKDKSSDEGFQFRKLKEMTQLKGEITLKDAGHALPFTHPKDIANTLKSWLSDRPKQHRPRPSKERPFGYFPSEHKKNNVCSFLTDHLEKDPDKEVLSWVSPESLASWSFDLNDPLPHDSISVDKLDALVSKIGDGMKALGIRPKDRVIVFVPMSLYMYASMFALQKIGAVAVFLDSWARRDQMGEAAKVVDAKAMVSVEKAFDYLGEDANIKAIPLKIVVGPASKKYDASIEQLMQSEGYADAHAVEQEHTALITFTTGSSGTPKGADRTHRFLAAQHYALNHHIPYEQNDADLPVFPIFSLNNLAAGVKTVIPAIDVGSPNEKDALILIAQMKSTQTTCTTLSPGLLRHVYQYCEAQKITLPFLKRIVTGGAPVSRDDLIKTVEIAPNAEVLVLYGSTEVEPMAHIEAQDMIQTKVSTDPEWVEEGVNVGKFDPGLSIRYLKINKDNILINKKEDWDSLIVPKYQVGEIIVSGEHVCENYFNNEEAFFRAKIRDENGVVWHRTGDLGRIDEKGDLWLVGRVHNAINRNETYLFPVRAEIVMKKLSFVDKAAFLGMPDPELGEKTYAVFTSREGAQGSEQEWREEISRIMKKNEIITDQIIYIDDIPMDPRHHSKVEYAILRKELLEREL